jgi:hypothetical protein
VGWTVNSAQYQSNAIKTVNGWTVDVDIGAAIEAGSALLSGRDIL